MTVFLGEVEYRPILPPSLRPRASTNPSISILNCSSAIAVPEVEDGEVSIFHDTGFGVLLIIFFASALAKFLTKFSFFIPGTYTP